MTGSLCLTEILKSWKSCSSKRLASQTADSTSASGAVSYTHLDVYKRQAFIRLSRSLDRIRDAERATAYLRSIVINLARDHNRRGLMSFRHRPPAQPDEPSAEEYAAANESRAEVIAALRELPHRQRNCVVLRLSLIHI